MTARSRGQAAGYSRDSAPYEAALMTLLPPHEQADLLAACLCERDVAQRAWNSFAKARGPKEYFEADQSGLKALLPFVEASLASRGIDAGKSFHTYARVASVREQLRSRIYGEILYEVLAACETAAIPAILLKGGALSAAVYPQPSMRHNHAIDLLVHEEHLDATAALLAGAQFSPRPRIAGAAYHRNFLHWTGLALGLHCRPLYLPHFEIALDGLRSRCRSLRLSERAVRVMSPEDTLVHVCGHATYSRSRPNLRWACDLFLLLQRNPDLDWSTVTALAVRARLALPVCVLLGWLRETLAAPIPAVRLEELRDLARPLDAVTAEGIYAALLHATLSRGTAFRAFASSRRAQLGFLRFSASPSPRYMRWKHAVDRNWQLAPYYADRPRRLARQLVARMTARGAA